MATSSPYPTNRKGLFRQHLAGALLHVDAGKERKLLPMHTERKIVLREEGKDMEASEILGRGMIVMRSVFLWLSYSTPGICPVKWHDIPWHTSGACAAGNVQ
ncbi:hypothetical protein KSB_91800 [Ktedonobacter robiniae]|uniref:Uncharacterized protein n=1 Tax=Ktedonobacter robiniae TaxID=2778365 RepID=A0ABQ3V786_9CHLR|nr:hypothetical protein KSB_91800 [Ktedonobacter robiniae]